jgi:hypothetical protein
MSLRGKLLKSVGSVNFHYLRNQTLVNEAAQKVYIATPKCACTSFKASAVALDRQTNGKALEVHNMVRQNSQFSAQRYSQSQLSAIYNHSEIISLWREPTARFRSAIIDKVVNLNKNESRGTISDIMHHVKRYATHQTYTYWEQSIFDDKGEKSKDLIDEVVHQVGCGILNSNDYELNPHFASQAYCQRLDLISSKRKNYKIESLSLALNDFMETTDFTLFELNKIPRRDFHELEVFHKMDLAVKLRFSTDVIIYESAL